MMCYLWSFLTRKQNSSYGILGSPHVCFDGRESVLHKTQREREGREGGRERGRGRKGPHTLTPGW